VAQTKYAEMLAWFQSLEIKFCETDQHVQRWMVNYLRHVGTAYDAKLEAQFGKVGVPEAHALLQSRMNTAAKAFILSPV
jgi:hypothetical protein